MAHGDLCDVFFTHLDRYLHLGEVGDLHALLAAARVTFAHDHAARDGGANLGVELHDAARAGCLHGALGGAGIGLVEGRLGGFYRALGARDGALFRGGVGRGRVALIIDGRCALCAGQGPFCSGEVFLRRGEGALGLGNIAIEAVVLDGHEHVAGIDLLARLHVDLCHGSVDGRGGYRCRDRLELAFCLNRGRKRSFLDRLEYGLVCGLRLRAHDSGRNDSDEYDAGDDARDNAATDELLAAALGALGFELSVCLFIGDGRILLLGVCGGQERQGLSRVYGQVLDLVLGGAGILSHGVSSIDSVSSMVYMLSSKVYMTTLDGVLCVRFLTSMLGTEGAARVAPNCAQEVNSTSATAPCGNRLAPLRK